MVFGWLRRKGKQSAPADPPAPESPEQNLPPGGTDPQSDSKEVSHKDGNASESQPVRMAALYERQAKDGDAHSCFLLGEMYESGFGVGRSMDKAISLFRAAAEKGDPDALAKMMELFERGKWLPNSRRDAVRLYKIAA